LLGQHRVSAALLAQQRRYAAAGRAVIGMFSYPDRLKAFCVGRILESRAGPTLRKAFRRLKPRPQPSVDAAPAAAVPVWIDGSALASRAGYRTMTVEWIRACAADASFATHVVASGDGRAALSESNVPLAHLHLHRLRSFERPGPRTFGGLAVAGRRLRAK